MKGQSRKSGIDVIGDVPWGTHICQFYQTKEDLMEILVNYFKAGLESNEYCLWVISQPIEVEDAKDALSKAIPDFNIYLEKGQIEIIPYTQWFINEGVFDQKRVLNSRLEKLNHALESGYEGMRLSGNTTWLEKEDWNLFVEFKEQTDKSMDTYRMINLCTYFVERHNASEIIDVVVNHQFALIKRDGKWKRMESSKRKQAEEAALQATKNWDYTFDSVPDPIAILDNEYRILRVNRVMAARLGMTPEECVGITCYSVVHGTDEPPSFCPHSQMLKDGLEHTREVHEDSLGGYFIVSVSPQHDSEGKLSGCIHIARDITKRKQAEEALRESEARLQVIIAHSPDIIFEQDRNLRYTRVFNPTSPLSVSDVLGKTDADLLPPDQAQLLTSIKSRVLDSGMREQAVLLLTHGSESRWFEAIYEPRYDEAGNVTGILSYTRDINERKQLEEQTRQRAEEMETIMEVAPVSIMIGHDPECKNITGNRMANELYEARVGENISANVTDIRRYFFKDRELTAYELPMQESALKDIDIRNIEFDVLLPSGECRAMLGSASPLHDTNGYVRGSVGAFIDITERKQVEKALRESEEKYRNLVETANEGILVIDAGHRITYANEKMAEMLGCSRKEVIGKSVLDFTDYEGKTVFENNMYKRRQGINESHEFRFITNDGLPLWTHVNSKSLFDKDGKFAGSMSMLTDISKRKDAESRLKETLDNLENSVKARTAELEQAYKLLKESEAGLAEAQRIAHIGNWDWDLVTDKVYWSDEMYRIYGRNPQEQGANYDELLKYVHPDDRDYVESTIKKGLIGEANGIDYRIVLSNGEERIVFAEAEVIFDEKNVPVRVKGITQDITERKKAEQAIELSEERYRIVTEQTGQLVYDYNIEEDAANWAGNIEELTNYTPEEFRGMNMNFWLSCIHPEDQDILLEKYEKCMQSGEAYRMEYRFGKKNGEYIYFEDNGIFLRDKKGNSNRVLGAVKDITERKKAELFVANIETARKKEIHHRIKNNLQVISSLLDLQSEKFRNRECVQDKEVMKAFRESQDRVTSIALIHEELHEGKGTDKLNFSPYLERLVKNLFQTYRLGNTKTSLKTQLEEDIFLDMDIAVPLGIIINELVSNSLKYAFTDKYKGLIQIKLCREEATENANTYTGKGLDSTAGIQKGDRSITNFVLTVSDDGVGIPENFNSEKSSSLGLQLVTILVDQLGGKLELKRDSGTEFVIRFAVKEKQ